MFDDVIESTSLHGFGETFNQLKINNMIEYIIMGLKENVLQFLHLDSKNPYIQASTILAAFYHNPEAVCYDLANHQVRYTGAYESFIQDINTKGRYSLIGLQDETLEIGIPYTDAKEVKSYVDKKYFKGLVKRYDFVYHDEIYEPEIGTIETSIDAQYLGFQLYTYDLYKSFLGLPTSTLVR